TEIVRGAAAVTGSWVAPVMPPIAAEMLVLPTSTAVARPVPLMVATPVMEEAQVTWVVRSWVEVSEKVPVAVSCWVVPLAMEGLVGVTAMDCSVAGFTVTVRSEERRGGTEGRGGGYG